MKQSLTPRKLAQALGVSESSMKRWVDEGRVRAARTAGGHRRIPLTEALRFVRSSSLELVAPDALGFPDLAGVMLPERDRQQEATRQLTDVLVEGDERRALALVLGLYLGGDSVAAIADGPVRGAMEEIGTRWQHSEDGLVVEHRASDIVNQALNQLRSLFPAPAGAMVAIGGALEGDPYLLASLAAATALTTEGIDAIHLGPNTPGASLALAARLRSARLVWVSVNLPLASGTIRSQLEALARETAASACPLIIGGKGLEGETLTGDLERVPRGASIAELVGFAKAIASTDPRP